MKRALVFALLLLVFAVWRFPHHRVVERLLARRLEGLPVEVNVGSVTPMLWPPGYRLADVVVQTPELRAALDTVDLAFWPGSGVAAGACGGALSAEVDDGDDAGAMLRLEFAGVDPSKCLSAGGFEVSGAFDGTLVLEGLGAGPRPSVLGKAARAGALTLEGRAGRVAGHLPARPASDAQRTDASGSEAQPPRGAPIGAWDFERVSLRVRLDDGTLRVEDASAEAEGLHWEATHASLAAATGGRTRVDAEMRARQTDDSPRAKAVLGMLPRADEKDGWRRYRITGTLDAPKVVGLR